MADFLFHQLSEKEKEDVKREARKILESFSEKLSKVKVPSGEPLIERKEFERAEKESSGKPRHEAPTNSRLRTKTESSNVSTTESLARPEDEDFRERMFSNTSNKNKDFIIAEKKGWD